MICPVCVRLAELERSGACTNDLSSESLCVRLAELERSAGADPGFRRGGFVQEFRLENRSYLDVHDFSLRMQVIIAND